MKILPVLLTHCLVGLLCLSLSACSSHTKKSALHPSGTQVSEADSQDEEISAVEPEETAEEELAALNSPGGWEFGPNGMQTYSLEKAGIDPRKYDFPITLNKQVLYYLGLFQGKQRKNFGQWLARSTAYRPFIETELKKAGLPRDLVYLAMIESGYNPSAYSPADACGLWQFLEGTGRDYGLKIDPWVDERREPEKATKAATRYLAKLYSQFGDWYLAVAAYNGGEGRIDTAMTNCNAKDFWEVSASEGIFVETKRYVPKLIAAIIIARDPEKYGFTEINYQQPKQFETITVPGGVDLEAVAVTANSSVKQLRSLNNELRRNQTPAKVKDYTLRIPVGTKELVASNLDKLRPVATTVYTTHTVKNGESLTAICSLYNISKTTLLKANNLKTAQLKKGLRLQIPSTATKYVLFKENQEPDDRLAKVEKGKRQLVLHQLKQGETLTKIAQQYQVPVKSILQWNKISNLSEVKKGQQISLYPDRPVSEAVTVLAKAAKTPVEKTTAAIPSLEATKKRSVAKAQPAPVPARPVTIAKKLTPETWYVVKNGDTLTAIAKKFETSAQVLRDWNKLSTNTLQTGNKLLVKKS